MKEMVQPKITFAKKDFYKKNAFLSFIINAVFLLMVILFCDMKYEVSDDFIVDSILSGAYGNGYDEHLLFSNIIYGLFLKQLYKIFPVVSWYFVFQIAICFFSLWAVTYIVLSRNDLPIGIFLSIIFVSFFSDDVYILVQFTKTAAIATCAGGALILSEYWKKNKRNKLVIFLGIFLTLVGSMIRFQAIYISLVYLFIMFVWFVFHNRKEIHIVKKTVICVAICLGTVAMAFIIKKAGEDIWNNDKAYGEYLQYNTLRASITDINSYGADSIMSQLEPLGFTITDYYMIDSWNFIDHDYFTEDKLKNISVIKKSYSDSVTKSLRYGINQFMDRKYYKYTTVMGLVVIFLILMLWDFKGSIIRLLFGGTAVFFLIYFIMHGRVVYRVEYSILVCTAIAILVTTERHRNVDIQIRTALIYFGVVVCVCKIPLYIKDTSYKTMSDEEYSQYIYDCFFESWNFKLKKYRCNVSERKPHENLMNLIHSDQEHYYLADFSSCIQLLYFNYKPWIRVEQGEYCNYSYLGGVTMGYPDNFYMWEAQGMDCNNPYKSLCNDNIYVIDNWNAETKMWYEREKYNSETQAELISTIDGFNLWKFRVD